MAAPVEQIRAQLAAGSEVKWCQRLWEVRRVEEIMLDSSVFPVCAVMTAAAPNFRSFAEGTASSFQRRCQQKWFRDMKDRSVTVSFRTLAANISPPRPSLKRPSLSLFTLRPCFLTLIRTSPRWSPPSPASLILRKSEVFAAKCAARGRRRRAGTRPTSFARPWRASRTPLARSVSVVPCR